MKVKNIFKKGITIVFLLLIVFCITNIYFAIRKGNQKIEIETSDKYYSNSFFTANLSVEDSDNNHLKAKVTAKLTDNEGKKVKEVEKFKYKIKEGEDAVINMQLPELETGTYYLETTVSSTKGKDTVKKAVYISGKDDENVIITFDKGIYKPSDEINYRALLLSNNDNTPLNKEVNISIYDGNKNRVYNENFVSSEFGIVSGKFKLADEVNSGTYKLTVTTENSEISKEFSVNPYTIPKFEVNLTTDKEEYLKDETLNGKITSKYFFGEVVKDATVRIKINEEEIKGKTNDNGEFEFSYNLKDAKIYSILATVTDTSNYVIEERKSVNVGTDIFEIELLPENKELIDGLDNDVYVFTKKIDGAPIKTYLTVSHGNTTRQVATDENGIGKFSLNIDYNLPQTSNTTLEREEQIIKNAEKFLDNYALKNSAVITEPCYLNVVAKDMQGNEVSKVVELNVSNANTIVKTDKVKYNLGEDIKVNIVSKIDSGNKNIYVYKNDRLLKMVSTDSDETTINLDENYGIIDIYVENENSKNESSKRTIFITPNKSMQIGIVTNKEEYNPGENINISFDVKENGNSVSSALLVSMLDEAILNLADNDLSIDNVKLALEDLEFSEDLDAATLYTAILENKSEQTIMGLLLRQESSDLKLDSKTLNNSDEKEEAIIKAVISGAIIVLIVVILIMKKTKKAKEIVKTIINVIATFVVVTSILAPIIYDLMPGYEIRYVVYTLIATAIVAISLYSIVLYRFKDFIFRITILLAIFAVLFVGFIYICELTYEPELVMLSSILAFILIYSIISTIKRKNSKLKENKIFIAIKKILDLMITQIIIIVLSGIILNIVIDVVDTYLDVEFGIILASIYVLNYIYEKMKNRETGTLKLIKGVLTAIGIIAIVLICLESMDSSIQYAPLVDDVITNNGGLYMDSISPSYSTGTAESSKGDLAGIGGIFDNIRPNSSNKEEVIEQEEIIGQEQKQEETEDNVRNVFLESMCFVPELIAEGGTAQLDLKLSDNITIWNIQTVGNTKQGTIGYSSKQVKVFKEFFVDFEMPNNTYNGDTISIPVTVYNYTESALNANIKIKEDTWFSLGTNASQNVKVEAGNTKMVYIPITIKEVGNKVLRVETTVGDLSDIVEKTVEISPKGYKKEAVVSSGTLEGKTEQDIIFMEETTKDSINKVTIKLYPTAITEVVEGMESIFRLPTGCFEQISSSLYPNGLALKYMKDNEIIDKELEEKALSYISSGYQKLLSYEVENEKGGFSLYGRAPAETVLTSYGLMELKDLSEVYSVDEDVLNRMKEYLFKKQKSDGSFSLTGSHSGGASYSADDLALNAYVIWGLSESYPEDTRLKNSIEYLENNIEKTSDNYTLALIANSLANTNSKSAKKAINKILDNISVDGDTASVKSKVKDYYGSYGNTQTIQTTALTSMALSKLNESQKTNEMMINYLIKNKSTNGTWYSTQATVLALKALITFEKNGELGEQEIIVRLNNEEQKIEVKENSLDMYTTSFVTTEKENKIFVNLEKGKVYYEIIQQYYVPYDTINTVSNEIQVSMQIPENIKVNDIVEQNILIENKSKESIQNAMVTIAIPQGFGYIEESLELLKLNGIIEKYETNYREINLYLRNFSASEYKNINIQFRAKFPIKALGGEVRVYDYYNPTVEGIILPKEITVK